MTSIVSRRTAALFFFCLFSSTAAFAQATRTWVSGVGDDANPCSRTAPCKTFAGAISKTAASGEINVLDPGGFGGVTITKAITIDGGGLQSGVLVSGTNAIIVNAGANDAVVLRGLNIDGLGTGLNGVNILSAKSVDIEDSTIYGFVTNAVNATTTNALALRIRNTIMRNNTNGVQVNNTGGALINKAMLDGVEISGCSGQAVTMKAGSRVGIVGSTITHNATGIRGVNPGAGLPPRAVIESTKFLFNTTAANIETATHMSFINTLMTNNDTGIALNGGTAASVGGNVLLNAVGNGPFSPTTAPQ